MRRVAIASLGILSVLVWGTLSMAGGVRLKPGKWEITTTSEVPMMPEAQVTKTTECVTEKDKDPLEAMVEGGDCRVTERSESNSTVKWKMECRSDVGPPSKGEGEFTAEGNSAHGRMRMVVEAGGQAMTLKHSWKGKRVGDCN